MGSEGGYSNERPVHTVYLDDYYIDRYEVTNQQFVVFLNEQGNQNEGSVNWLDENDKDVLIHRANGNYQANSGFEDYPVIMVSWFGAQAYCEWRGANLPTEAEWEKAARGTEGNIYPWGNDFNSSLTNSKFIQLNEIRQTAPVGSFSGGASLFGVEDMAGNVWEWTLSLDQVYPYDALDGRNNLDATGNRVVRGGTFGGGFELVLRSAVRSIFNPSNSVNSNGFRCARDVD